MVSIIIVNYNQKNLLKNCLNNILKAGISIDYEIIIIDNNSNDNSKEFLSKLNIGNININIVLNNHNKGYASANNQGIKLSERDYILCLNPDVIVLPNSIEILYKFLKKHDNAGIVGPQLLNPDKTIQHSCCRFPRLYTPVIRRTFLQKLPLFKKEIQRYLMHDFDHKSTRQVDWLIGACIMIKKKVLNDIGIFDNRFFLYFEDVDLARRVWKAGYKVYYHPKAVMIHFHQRLSASKHVFSSLLTKVTWIHISSALKYFSKWKWKSH